MPELREFQLAAVKRIVARLTDPGGSKRFLLADEVGLGKTLVAKGVIDGLRRLKKRGGFTIVYICSNTEIADQNREKLCDDKKSVVPGRLSLLALRSREIDLGWQNGELQVFAFTPGTSLQVEHGTGIARERRLLLYLLHRIWRKPVNRIQWRRFFRCSAGPEIWEKETQSKRLCREFFRKIAGDLQIRLKAQWDSQQVRLLNTAAEEGRAVRLSDCIDLCVDALAQNEDSANRQGAANRKNRNRIIGELRKGLARVSLEFLQPNLIILDEFQRFSDILLETRNESSVVGKLFAKDSAATLILSATPYKMFTLAHEKEDHHEDFLKTLAFLKNEPLDGSGLIDIQADLRIFRERLKLGEWVAAHDQTLYELRERIETRLKEVMCRTERNWYLDNAAKGVEEVPAPHLVPQEAELLEYVRLRRCLLSRNVGDWNITDFWKSSPSVLSFMDSHYGLMSRIRRDRIELPANVLRPNSDLPELAGENAKFRLLFERLFGAIKPESGQPSWKYLWVCPTYTYYRDDFFAGFNPTKFLVFSHWRFVPKAISVLTSLEAVKRIGRTRRRLVSAPLQFKEKLAFYPFDVCYPSSALAASVQQLPVSGEASSLPSAKELFLQARRKIQALLSDAGVQIGKTRTAPLWQIMARVEARSEFSRDIRSGFEHVRDWCSEETTLHLPKHAEQYLDWMDDDGPLSITPVWLDRLTLIALHSPAISVLRAFMSVFPQGIPETWGKLLELCIGPLRHYFNKPPVQNIVRRHGMGKSYTERILSYCQQAHFQAVMDEYSYLVRNVLQQQDTDGFLSHIGRAMGMWAGKTGVNDRTGKGHISRRPKIQPTHFALAFGDDVSSESIRADGKARKSVVREAFNSPFWPFVLATTSVGQEGLDFHLYCRDIVHWNLPSNPVDLEQREGRINRYDGLSIRRNVGRDFPLTSLRLNPGENVWKKSFEIVSETSKGNGRFKHGLFPHWIYEHAPGPGNIAGADHSMLRRHLLSYAGSRDQIRYADLKTALALYRLVFGQPRQQDILEQVSARHPNQNSQELSRALATYMINLSPFDPEDALSRAQAEADRLLRNPDQLKELIRDVPKRISEIPACVLKEIETEIAPLLAVVKDDTGSTTTESRLAALTAILYLLDPYDAVPDRYGIVGYNDDIAVIRRTRATFNILNRATQGVRGGESTTTFPPEPPPPLGL